jgi:transcriptional regulator GlxA family with amidase domain
MAAKRYVLAFRAQSTVLDNSEDVKSRDPRIQRAIALLSASPATPVQEIAVSLNLSVSRLRHIFKAELGVSPKQYARQVRFERARNLLRSTFLRVKEVTAAVGVNDPSHFVRDYKGLFRHTPSQERTEFSRQLANIAKK